LALVLLPPLDDDRVASALLAILTTSVSQISGVEVGDWL
jgi:hypothetical protein